MNATKEVKARLTEVRNAKDGGHLEFMHGHACGFLNAMFRLDSLSLEEWQVACRMLENAYTYRSREIPA